MDAYSQLKNFQETEDIEILSRSCPNYKDLYLYEIARVKTKFKIDSVSRDQFLSDYYATSNSYFQSVLNKKVSTHIANIGMPFPQLLTPLNKQNKDCLYSNLVKKLAESQVNKIFAVKNTSMKQFCISYSELLQTWAFTYGYATILCSDEEDLRYYEDPLYEKVSAAAKLFFSKLPTSKIQALQSDLERRSLVGFLDLKTIKYFGIVEHYSLQRCLPIEKVKKFLNHYNLELATYREISNDKHIENLLPEIIDSINNHQISEYSEREQGETVYFYQNQSLVACCYIEYKWYFILQKMFKETKFPISGIERYKFLDMLDLNAQQRIFFEKVYDMITANQGQMPNHKLVSYIFNAIHRKSKNLDIRPPLLPLHQCLEQKLIVLLPFGLPGVGFRELFDAMGKISDEVTIVNNINSVEQTQGLFRVVCVDQAFTYKELDKAAKQLNAFQTIALIIQSSSQYYNNDFCFPFSLQVISQSLFKQNQSEESLKKGIEHLLTFNKNKMCSFPTTTYLKYHVGIQQNELMGALQKEDIDDALIKKEGAIKQLQESLISTLIINEEHVEKEARALLSEIENACRMKISKKKVSFKQQQIQGLKIKDIKWDEIDNRIVDALEIICKHSKDSHINNMYKMLESQLFRQGKAHYQKETNPYISTKYNYRSYQNVQITTLIVVVNGLIILYPKDFANKQIQYLDIPIYSLNLEVQKSQKVVSQVIPLIMKATKQPQWTKITILDKTWDVCVIKLLEPIIVDLIEV